jgi:hypothetical protein
MLRSILVSSLVLVSLASWAEGGTDTKNEPAWTGLFIQLPNYDLRYQTPVVEKKDKPRVYRQKASYTWLGGRFETVEITLARDPGFREKYSPEALRKEEKPPTELKLNKKRVWRWAFPEVPGQLDRVRRRLVVVLDADKVILLEQKGSGLTLEDVAKRLDFAKIEKGLARPPRR